MHGKADMLRAVIEGVMYSQRDSLEILKKWPFPNEVYNCGGGARSPSGGRCSACVGLPVKRLSAPSARPALPYWLRRSRLYPTAAEGCKAMVSDEAEHSPDTKSTLYMNPIIDCIRNFTPT